MFSCALHNWFSYDFPCPACMKDTTSTTDIIINDEGTNKTDYHAEDKISQLQQLLSEKEKELEYWKQRCERIAVLLQALIDQCESRGIELNQTKQSFEDIKQSPIN